MNDINGLAPTRTRLALTRAIAAGGGDVYCEAGVVYSKSLGMRVTERVREQVTAGWIRALTPDEPRGPGETSARSVTYYRVLDPGQQALRSARRSR
jgi:hypothetical protein